jgi:hypothetical protein
MWWARRVQLMQTQTIRRNFALTVVVTLLSLFVALLVSGGQASAQDAKSTEQTKETKTTTAAKPATYDFVAKSGDSYTVMARKSVQTQANKDKVKLSNEQIVFAETNLTILAGSPELSVGQSVKIDRATVKAWVDKATKLTDAQKAAWTPYTINVNFDTSKVGA